MTTQAFDCICNIDPTPAFIHPSVVRGVGSHVCAGSWIGPDCYIGPGAFVGPYSQMIGYDIVEAYARIAGFMLAARDVLIEEGAAIGPGALMGQGSIARARMHGGAYIYLMDGSSAGPGSLVDDYGFLRRGERLPAGAQRLGVRKPRGPRIRVVETCLDAVKSALRTGVRPPGYEEQVQRSLQASLPSAA